MKPTPAQIEAAAKAIISNNNYPLPLRTARALAEVALTAAAEVGEPTPERIRSEREITFHQTIERCAQAAKEACDKWQIPSHRIVAAIRALKDKPPKISDAFGGPFPEE